MVTGGFGPPARVTGRGCGFLTLCLQRLARRRIGECPLELGLRLLTDVGALDRGHGLCDLGLEGSEARGERGELLQELARRRVGRLLRTLLEIVEAGLELLRRRVELVAELVTRLRV